MTPLGLIILLLCMVPIILLPIAIYGNIKLYRFKNDTFIEKRSLSILFGINISFCILIFIYPFPAISFFHFGNELSAVPFNIFIFFWYLLLLYFLNVRNWLIYYRYKWNYHTIEYQYKLMINSSLKNKISLNWFLRYRSTFGNNLYILKLFAIIHFILFLSCSTGYLLRIFAVINQQKNNQNNNNHFSNQSTLGIILLNVSLIIPIIFYAIIAFKTPSFNDYYFIHFENKLHSRLLILLQAWPIIANIIANFTNIYIFLSILSTPLIIILFFMNYVSTYLIISKNINNKISHNLSTDLKVKAKQITLEQILMNKHALHQFMQHLFTEYSIECLISFIEFTQFQKYILQNGHGKENNVKMDDIHSDIPKSNIFDNDKQYFDSDEEFLKDVKLKSNLLYNKYIKTECELELNISSEMRQELTDILYDKDRLMTINVNFNDLMKLIEKPKIEMKLLLECSHSRFKLKAEYENVIAFFERRATAKTVLEIH